jgi:hypothetical protein
MKYWRFHKVPFFFSYLFKRSMENKGWKVTKIKGVLVHMYRTSTYDRELYLNIYR